MVPDTVHRCSGTKGQGRETSFAEALLLGLPHVGARAQSPGPTRSRPNVTTCAVLIQQLLSVTLRLVCGLNPLAADQKASPPPPIVKGPRPKLEPKQRGTIWRWVTHQPTLGSGKIGSCLDPLLLGVCRVHCREMYCCITNVS